MKTRVYAIPETDDVHEISNEDFINQAEDLGLFWGLLGFQNHLNGEGRQTIDHYFVRNLHFRFIDIKDENDLDDNSLDSLQWFRSFANYISNNCNDVYNDAMKFADKREEEK